MPPKAREREREIKHAFYMLRERRVLQHSDAWFAELVLEHLFIIGGAECYIFSQAARYIS